MFVLLLRRPSVHRRPTSFDIKHRFPYAQLDPIPRMYIVQTMTRSRCPVRPGNVHLFRGGPEIPHLLGCLVLSGHVYAPVHKTSTHDAFLGPSAGFGFFVDDERPWIEISREKNTGHERATRPVRVWRSIQLSRRTIQRVFFASLSVFEFLLLSFRPNNQFLLHDFSNLRPDLRDESSYLSGAT